MVLFSLNFRKTSKIEKISIKFKAHKKSDNATINTSAEESLLNTSFTENAINTLPFHCYVTPIQISNYGSSYEQHENELVEFLNPKIFTNKNP